MSYFVVITRKLVYNIAKIDQKRRKNMSDTRPIGMFDSGVGGLTVLKEVIKQNPNENIIYPPFQKANS